MKVSIKKYASGLHNTPLLPGQMFKSREDLIKAVKTALQMGQDMSPEQYGGRMKNDALDEGIRHVQSILKSIDSKMNGLLLENSMYGWDKFFRPVMRWTVWFPLMNRWQKHYVEDVGAKTIAQALQGVQKLQQTFNEKRSFGPNWQQHSKEIFQLGVELVNLQKTMNSKVSPMQKDPKIEALDMQGKEWHDKPPMSTGTPQAAPAAPAAQPL